VLKKAGLMVVMLILCTACSKLDKKYGAFKPDRNKDYLKEHETAALKLPDHLALDPRAATDHYPLPQGPRPAPGAEPISIIPPTLTTALGGSQDATQ
jgi:uncharacterized lipoprotein